jgi:hypothetical protein
VSGKQKKSFSELSPKQRTVAVIVITISLWLVAAAERDIGRRKKDEVRGSRFIWRVVSLNALGAISYFRWGRRAAAPEDSPVSADAD